jgi:hypothetical protein
MQYDAIAGLARVALAEGDGARAMTNVERVLSYMAGGGRMTTTEDPHVIRLSCYRVLAHVGDPRAGEVLDGAHANLLAKALLISDATLRHSVLHDIPEYREIVAAWSAREAAAASGR